jgi:hypothetical protein
VDRVRSGNNDSLDLKGIYISSLLGRMLQVHNYVETYWTENTVSISLVRIPLACIFVGFYNVFGYLDVASCLKIVVLGGSK